MSDHLGSFSLVLHGHLPYVLRHGTWPHGEDWLYEAAAETYLPILDVVGECALMQGNPKIVMGLTPVLLEQLAHEHFKKGFEHYLKDRIARAQLDQKDFKKFENGHMAYLAERWEAWYTARLDQFTKMDRDIPRSFAQMAIDGHMEILTSNATHGYMPLLYEDSSIRGQIRAGIATSERILGFRPTGMWLPECAYRPQGPWDPPIGWGRKDMRIGIEHLAADEGITHFFTESHLIEGCKSECASDGDGFYKVGWDDAEKYPGRGWRSVNEPHGVNSDGSCQHRIAAFARDQNVCEKVWSGTIGYPASGEYLEFHKMWGAKRGLRYWKITGKKTDLGDKHLYYPQDIEGKLHEHVSDFCSSIKQRLQAYKEKTDGKTGIVVTCFDAELFGHWWFEGPRFIRDVMLSLNSEPLVEVTTTKEYLDKTYVDKIATLPEGSWGEEGDHRVWSNEQVNWMWDIEYRCEAMFGKFTSELPWRENKEVKELLEKAGRELLLLQASDWPFVIRRGQAIDYGIKRFMQHVARFETLIDLAEKVSSDSDYLGQLNEVEKHEIADADLHDVIFPKIDLNWWNM